MTEVTAVAMSALAGMAAVARAQDAPHVAAIARTGNIAITGLVVDPSGVAIPDVQVEQLEHGKVARTTRTGRDGFFELRQLPRGAVDFSFRRIGFKLRTLTVDVEQGADPLQLVLEPAATHLDTMVVLAKEKLPPHMQAFYDRARLGFGTFLDSAAIQKYGATQLTKVVTRAPGVLATTQRGPYNRTGSQDVIKMVGPVGLCNPTILIDGVRWTGLLDRELSADGVRAIEVYSKPLDVPPELVPNPGSCGAIAIWTR